MPITPNNPFKWRHFPGEVILLCVRSYLRYPLAYEHVSELLVERGVAVHPTCIWRWVQTYAPELDKRCRPHLKPANKSYRTDETYIKVKGEDKYLYRAVDSTGQTIDFLLTAKRDAAATLLPQGSQLSRQSRAARHQRGQEPSLSAGGGSVKSGKDVASSGPLTSVQVPQQYRRTGPSDGEETDVVGERGWVAGYGVADVARDRSHKHDSQGPGEVGCQRRLHRTGPLHWRALRPRNLRS